MGRVTPQVIDWNGALYIITPHLKCKINFRPKNDRNLKISACLSFPFQITEFRVKTVCQTLCHLFDLILIWQRISSYFYEHVQNKHLNCVMGIQIKDSLTLYSACRPILQVIPRWMYACVQLRQLKDVATNSSILEFKVLSWLMFLMSSEKLWMFKLSCKRYAIDVPSFDTLEGMVLSTGWKIQMKTWIWLTFEDININKSQSSTFITSFCV